MPALKRDGTTLFLSRSCSSPGSAGRTHRVRRSRRSDARRRSGAGLCRPPQPAPLPYRPAALPPPRRSARLVASSNAGYAPLGSVLTAKLRPRFIREALRSAAKPRLSRFPSRAPRAHRAQPSPAALSALPARRSAQRGPRSSPGATFAAPLPAPCPRPPPLPAPPRRTAPRRTADNGRGPLLTEQGQSHGTGGGWPAAAGPALARRRFTAAAGRARNARGAAGCDRREGDEGREGPPGPGAAPLPLLPPSLPPARALSAARRLGEPSCAATRPASRPPAAAGGAVPMATRPPRRRRGTKERRGRAAGAEPRAPRPRGAAGRPSSSARRAAAGSHRAAGTEGSAAGTKRCA